MSDLIDITCTKGFVQEVGVLNTAVTLLTTYAHFFITCKPTHRAFCYDERTLRKKTYKTAIVKLLDTIGWLKIQLILI